MFDVIWWSSKTSPNFSTAVNVRFFVKCLAMLVYKSYLIWMFKQTLDKSKNLEKILNESARISINLDKNCDKSQQILMNLYKSSPVFEK